MAPPSDPAERTATDGNAARRRLPASTWWLGLTAVAAMGLVATVWATRAPPPTATLVAGNVPVNAATTGDPDALAHNSPTLVINPTDPTNLAVTSRVDAPQFGCALHGSVDGGASWVRTPVPTPAGKEPACFAPDAAFGADGTLYVSFTSFADLPRLGTVPDAVWLAVSDDGGRTLSRPRRVGGALAFQVRLAADPIIPDRVYLTWLQTEDAVGYGPSSAGNPIVVSRSDDAGRTWSEPERITPAGRQRVVAPVPAADADGGLYVAYLDVGDDRLDYHGAHDGRGGPAYPGAWTLVIAHSTDGSSWRETELAADLVPTTRFLMLFPPAPSLAVDEARGRVYVAFHDARHSSADVWVWASPDGVTWRPRQRVNDTSADDGTAQYLPALAVAPNGRLDATYYDRRADPDGVLNEVSWQSSFDGGATFTPRTVISDVPFDSRIGHGSDRDLPDLGDRLGLLATDAGSLAVWADTRAGERLTGRQDLASALIAVTGPPPLRRSVPTEALLGACIAVLVVAAVVAGRRGSRRRRAPQPTATGGGSSAPASS